MATTNKLLPERAWKQLLRGAQNGSQRAMNRLYEEATPIIRGMANYYKNAIVSADEFYSEGCHTLVKIANDKKYSPSSVKRYILRSLKRRMTYYLQKENFVHRLITSLDAAAQFERPNGTLTLMTIKKNLVDAKATNPNSAFFLKEVLAKIATLKPREKEVYVKRLLGFSSAEIGKKLGISELYVNKIKERVLKELLKWRNT